MQSRLTDKDFESIELAYDTFIKPVFDKLFEGKNHIEKALIYDSICDYIWVDYDIKEFNFNNPDTGKSCNCLKEDHETCWTVSPNPDCSCCMETFNQIP